VDTQYLLGKIFADQEKVQKMMYCPDPDAEEVELVFVNTCGFIEAGRNEMFATVQELLDAGKRVYLLGCALQYFEKLVKELDTDVSQTSFSDEWKDWQKIVQDPKVQFLSWGDFEKVNVGALIK
jgi:tRNA A37 methylthiotransferase MiaB